MTPPNKANILAVLNGARKLIVDLGWTQKAFARDKNGRSLGLRDSEPVAYCSMGALWQVATQVEALQTPDVLDARDCLAHAIGLPRPPDVISWNDAPTRTQGEVVAAFDAAIKATEAL